MNVTVAHSALVTELLSRAPFRLGNATIDPLSREGRWEGGEERLQPLTLKVLLVLRSRAGEVVTRDELTELCWDGRIIGDAVINRSISLLRHFAERAGGFEIETVPRCGYRLIENRPAPRAKRARWLMAAIALIGSLAGGAYFIARHGGARPVTLNVAVRSFTAPRGDSVSADIAFRTDNAIIRMLTESGISVLDPGITNAPGRADFILTGSVGPSAGGHAATIRLEEPVHHAVVMVREIASTSSDPEALPEQIGAQISAALSGAAPLVRIDKYYSTDTALLSNVLNKNASTFASQTNYENARRTAANAPSSIIAQLDLAMRTGMNIGLMPPVERSASLAAGRQAAARLLRLAPQFGDSYVPWCFLHAEVRIAECEAELKKGLAADPRAQSVGITLGKLLLNVGRINDAVPLAGTTLAKNPYSATQIGRLLLALDADGQTAEADSAFKRGRALWPEAPGMFFNRVSGMLARGDFDAVSKLDEQVTASGIAQNYASIAGQLNLAIRERSRSLAREACSVIPRDDDLPMIECMLASARMGDLDQAFEFAERLYPRRTGGSAAEEEGLWLANPNNEDTLYLVSSGAAPMRTDPRFLALAARLGLVRYWRQNAPPDFCARDHEPICKPILGR